MRLAEGLYPAAWRLRYGAEFEALLEDMEPRWGDVWNVAGGAMKMQMTTWTWWKLVPALGLAGAVAMAVAAAMIQPMYQSSAVLRVTPTVISEGQRGNLDLAMAERMDYLRTKTLGRGTLAGIIATEKLYPGETVEDGVARMQRNIQIVAATQRNGGLSGALMMSFRYPDAGKARRVIVDLMGLMGLKVRGNLAADGDGRPASMMEVLDPASLPRNPLYPNWRAMIAVGLGAGLLMGTLFCARTAWRLVLLCGAIGAPLAVGWAALLPGRSVAHSVIVTLAALGFVAGMAIGSVAVLLRRRPLAG